jgi:nucleotide-binding universal stress UspA family protein
MWQRILVPIDGSTLSKTTIARAWPLLERTGVEVKVVLVAEASPGEADDPRFRDDPRHADARVSLAEIRDDLVKRMIRARAELLFGDPATEILREASHGRADVIAMSTHGRTGLGRVLFGSVALKVLQASPVPLLLYRPLVRPDGSLSPADELRETRFRRVLVPLDGSEGAEEIWPAAESVARMFASRLVLFTAVPGGAEEKARRRLAAEYLAKRARALEAVGLATEIEVRAGAPAQEALHAIFDLGLDAVAMTTHGHRGAAALYGSVAEHLLTRAEVPLIVIRNRRFRTPLPAADALAAGGTP